MIIDLIIHQSIQNVNSADGRLCEYWETCILKEITTITDITSLYFITIIIHLCYDLTKISRFHNYGFYYHNSKINTSYWRAILTRFTWMAAKMLQHILSCSVSGCVSARSSSTLVFTLVELMQVNTAEAASFDSNQPTCCMLIVVLVRFNGCFGYYALTTSTASSISHMHSMTD